MHTARLYVVTEGDAVHNRKWHHNTSLRPPGQTNASENINLPKTSFAGG